ncbi:E2/UBC family protein B [Algoriphagus boseongensis]|uniref:E2/UBC family protein B n=1 Tax=Algoriphagus boseongensis TaxID=1442587 RepID=A0A4R6T384_9BACT|nr:ThiF family adenylyltransferase [Algoriphagus boseongensis]TDQ16644.1 E2/UBC family protein B [Algoriphagus boseongensis]
MINFEEEKKNALEALSDQYEILVLENKSLEIPGKHKLSHYWQVKVPVDSILFEFDFLNLIVGIPQEFPLVLPKIFLPRNYNGKLLFLPHVDQNRLICTYDEERSIPNPNKPIQQIQFCLLKAKKILEAGLKEENFEDYKDEFIAYWEQTYENEESKVSGVLSFINEELTEGTEISFLVLDNKLGIFDYILLGNSQNSKKIQYFLDEWNYKYNESRAFFVGKIDFKKPPFELKNKDLNKHIRLKERRLQNQFFKFLSLNQGSKIVLFDTGLEGTRSIQGLKIGQLPISGNGFRKGKISAKLAFQSIESQKKITRLSIIPIDSNRLHIRTAGVVNNFRKENRFVIAGLGSIGSNLMYFLSSFPNPSFNIIDPDSIQTENISRHFLGLNYTGRSKVKALKYFFQHYNPNIEIISSIGSIITEIENSPETINKYDLLFVCIGNWNIEKWISDAQIEKKIKIPICFIWVEPYLLGGHALYIHPNDNRFKEFFNENDLFERNIISSTEYLAGNKLLSLRESGCQSSYRPYSKEKVIMFLSKLFPHLKSWIEEKPTKSESFTWKGYEEESLKGQIKFEDWVYDFKDETLISHR